MQKISTVSKNYEGTQPSNLESQTKLQDKLTLVESDGGFDEYCNLIEKIVNINDV